MSKGDHHDEHVIDQTDPRYPAQLREIADAPTRLYIKGDPLLLSTPQCAIIGSRRATPVGIATAKHFAAALVKYGITITSGLALGIDGASHDGALCAKGKTIAVLGSGLNTVYPQQHLVLAKKITATGALISELPPSSPPKAHHFPRRNRIISGLSRCILVVEATMRSGSLITTRHALEQNRDVLAIPGSIHNPYAKGCHYLLQQGAKLIQTVEDIIEECFPDLGATPVPPLERSKTEQIKPLSPSESQVLAAIGYENTNFDDIVRHTGLTPSSLYSMLLKLELEGYINGDNGRYYRVPFIFEN